MCFCVCVCVSVLSLRDALITQYTYICAVQIPRPAQTRNLSRDQLPPLGDQYFTQSAQKTTSGNKSGRNFSCVLLPELRPPDPLMGTTNIALCVSVCPFFTSMEAADEKTKIFSKLFILYCKCICVYLCVCERACTRLLVTGPFLTPECQSLGFFVTPDCMSLGLVTPDCKSLWLLLHQSVSHWDFRHTRL